MKRLVSILFALAVCATLVVVVWANGGTVTVVSDTSVDVYGPLSSYAPLGDPAWGSSSKAVATWVHGSWPSISGATWISTASYVEDPVNDSWRWFHDEMTLPCTAYNISPSVVRATSDNAEEFYFNQLLVDSDGEVQVDYFDDAEWGTIQEYPISPQPGLNILDFIVRNYACYSPTRSGSYFCGTPPNPQSNPAGLIYKATVNYEMPDPVTLLADQDIPVGQVTVWDDGTTLYVEFTTTGGWEIVKTHLHIAGSMDGIPQKNGNPIPGQFAYKKDSAPWVYEIAVDDLPSGNPVYIAAHAVVQKEEVITEAPYYASVVVNSEQGLRKDGTPVRPGRSNPAQGLAYEPGQNETNFFSLGFGGWISVEFACPIRNGDGNDVQVIEDTWGGYPLEKAEVYASQDGVNWTLLGEADNITRDELGIHSISEFDLGGLGWARYIKVVDTTDSSIHAGDADGFDLNAVVALQDCIEITEETAWGDGADFTGKNWATYFMVPFGCGSTE